MRVTHDFNHRQVIRDIIAEIPKNQKFSWRDLRDTPGWEKMTPKISKGNWRTTLRDLCERGMLVCVEESWGVEPARYVRSALPAEFRDEDRVEFVKQEEGFPLKKMVVAVVRSFPRNRVFRRADVYDKITEDFPEYTHRLKEDSVGAVLNRMALDKNCRLVTVKERSHRGNRYVRGG